MSMLMMARRRKRDIDLEFISSLYQPTSIYVKLHNNTGQNVRISKHKPLAIFKPKNCNIKRIPTHHIPLYMTNDLFLANIPMQFTHLHDYIDASNNDNLHGFNPWSYVFLVTSCLFGSNT